MSIRPLQELDTESDFDLPTGLLTDDESILFRLSSNLTADGKKEHAVVVITNHRLLKFTVYDGNTEMEQEYNHDDIKKLDVQNLVGNVLLQIRLEQGSYCARYTLSITTSI